MIRRQFIWIPLDPSTYFSLSLYPGRGQGRGFFKRKYQTPLPSPLPAYGEREGERSPARESNNYVNHGIMLTEMLFVISILAVILILEAQLFNSSLRTIGALPQAHARAAQFNQMTTSLGRDVWGAATIELTGQRQVALGYPDGSSTRWDFNEDGRITRSPSTQPAESRQWNITPSPTLERTASGLTVKTSSKLSDATDSRPLFSQMLVLTEENR